MHQDEYLLFIDPLEYLLKEICHTLVLVPFIGVVSAFLFRFLGCFSQKINSFSGTRNLEDLNRSEII